LAIRIAWPVPTAMTSTRRLLQAAFLKAGISTSKSPEFWVLVVEAMTSRLELFFMPSPLRWKTDSVFNFRGGKRESKIHKSHSYYDFIS
jgi:hypothetical protein